MLALTKWVLDMVATATLILLLGDVGVAHFPVHPVFKCITLHVLGLM